MPVVQIHALPPPSPDRVDACLAAVVTALSDGLGCEPAGVWAQWCAAAAMHTGPQRRDFAGHCPVVIIRARRGRAPEQIAQGLAATAAAVATSLGLPLDDVWVHWQELDPAQVFAGGQLQG